MVRLTGRQAVNYQGVQASSPPNFVSYNRVPTPTDWQNFYLGDLWLVNNKTLPQDQFVYILVSLRNNIANWVRFTGGNGSLISLTGNSGGTVYGDVNSNIFTIGDVSTILATGNPADNTITLSVVGGRAAASFPTDSGTATPILGVLNVFGDTRVTTSASGNTITVGLASSFYSTGTWTPGISFGGASVGVTYTLQSGSYQIFGNAVLLSGTFTLSSKGSSTGTINITGFPFTIPTTIYRQDFQIQWATGLTLDSGFSDVWGEGVNSSTTSFLNEGSIAGGNFARLSNTNISNTFSMTLTGFYFLS
jgi:hypothetical protein